MPAHGHGCTAQYEPLVPDSISTSCSRQSLEKHNHVQVPLLSQLDEGRPNDDDGENTYCFKWGGRDCRGCELHEACMQNNIPQMRRILDENPSIVHSRFNYQTKYEEKVQEGSGEAIHLCASKGYVEAVDLLVQRNASLCARVTRDHEDHYDVLHAAVFAEGRGGSIQMVKYLLNSRAAFTNNIDGHSVLHKAFQVAKLDIIPVLRQALEAAAEAEVEAAGNDCQAREEARARAQAKYDMETPIKKSLALLESGHSDDSSAFFSSFALPPPLQDVFPCCQFGKAGKGPIETPLELGIRMGRLSEDQLSRIALPTTESLQVFMALEPRCIKSFLKRPECDNLDLQCVTVTHIAKVITQAPESACALLSYLSCEPYSLSRGWHPLPTRMSFAPRTFFGHLKLRLNPMPKYQAFYEDENVWGYNNEDFKYPSWHDSLIDRSPGRPIRDIGVQVCQVKGIACAEFLIALDNLSGDDDLIFQHPVVKGVLDVVWWNGACNQDVLQFVITTFGLALMLFEFYWASLDPSSLEAEERRLRHAGNDNSGAQTISGEVDLRQLRLRGSDHFVVARGIVDLIREAAQLIGYMKLGQGTKYINWANVYDLFFCALPISFLYNDCNQISRLLVIMYYWLRLIQVNFAERLSCELLPIVMSANSLVPAFIVFLIGFLAFTHMATVLLPLGTSIWPDIIYDSFVTLITAALPEHDAGNIRLIFAYVSVTLFSVFFLNIFIGVMFESYLKEKKRVGATFTRVRCSTCLTFLLRSNVFPGKIIHKHLAAAIIIQMAGAIVWLQHRSIVYGKYDDYDSLITVCGTCICLMTMVLCCYQTPHIGWKDNGPQNYLWLAIQTGDDAEEQEADDEDEDELQLPSIRTSLMVPGTPHPPAPSLEILPQSPNKRVGDMGDAERLVARLEAIIARMPPRSGSV